MLAFCELRAPLNFYHTKKNLSKMAAAYKIILDKIKSGDLYPGSNIIILELSREISFGLTPTREALIHLCAEGLVIHNGITGFKVQPIHIDKINAIYEVAYLITQSCLCKYNSNFIDASASNVWLEIEKKGPMNNLLELIEGIYETIAIISQNLEIASIIRRFLLRTHFIRKTMINDIINSSKLELTTNMIINSLRKKDINDVITQINMFEMTALRRTVENLTFDIYE